VALNQTFLFADLAGFTALTEAHGDEPAATRAAAGEPEGVQFQRHGEVRFRNVADAVLVHRAVRSGRRAGELPVDPVCRMTIAPNASAGRLAHDGVEYQFCSLDCVAKFAADPDRYLA
jgi:YHS domain-containing protein